MQQFFDKVIPAKAAEDQREYRSTQQDYEHHRADLDGLARHVAQNIP